MEDAPGEEIDEEQRDGVRVPDQVDDVVNEPFFHGVTAVLQDVLYYLTLTNNFSLASPYESLLSDCQLMYRIRI